MAQQRMVPSPTPVFVNETLPRQALAAPAAFLNAKPQAIPFRRTPYFTYLEM
jgi:hypothetical protein